MALLTPATDIKSSTIEGGLLEIAQLLQAAEQAVTPAVNRIQITYNTDTNLVSITASLPIAATVGSTGKIEFVATPYA